MTLHSHSDGKRKTRHPKHEEILQLIHNVFATSCNIGGIVALPNLLIPGQWLEEAAKAYEDFVRRTSSVGANRKISVPMAELVRMWFVHLGFRADRTRMNLYGYPGLFRELLHPPPWVEVEPEDFDGPLSSERADELKPLYLSVEQHADLLECYREYLREEQAHLWLPLAEYLRKNGKEQLLPPNLQSQVEEVELEDFAEKVLLARTLGSSTIEDLVEAIFDYDEFELAVGAPDLFVWDPESTPPVWFFGEVKGPRDHLQPTQYEWIQRNWDKIKGRVVLISVCNRER